MSLLIYYFFAFLPIFSPPSPQDPLESFYKKIECDSPANHKIKNIDFIYLINLDRRPERLASSLIQLAAFGITPYRFSAVDAKMLSLKDIDNLGIRFLPPFRGGVKASRFIKKEKEIAQVIEKVNFSNYGHTYFSNKLSLGALGCMLSHLSILQHAYDAGFETIWILEDDFALLKNPHALSDLIERLNQITEWDILFTDQKTNFHPEYFDPCPIPLPFNPNRNWFFKKDLIDGLFFRINARWGAYSMIVHRSGIKKILDWIKTYRLYHPIDVVYYLIPTMNLFTVVDSIVSTSYLPSDTEIYLEKIHLN